MIFAPPQPRIIDPRTGWPRCPRCGKWRLPRHRTPRTHALRRIFPHWRGGVPAMNASSGLQVSSTGLVVSVDGLVVTDTSSTGDACCCCWDYTYFTTNSLSSATFSGITTNNNCHNEVGPGTSDKLNYSDINNTWALTRNAFAPSAVEFRYLSTVNAHPSPGQYDSYGALNCTGGSVPVNMHIHVAVQDPSAFVLACSVGGVTTKYADWEVQVTDSNIVGAISKWLIFYARGTGCLPQTAISNQLPSPSGPCFPSGIHQMGSGGSVTLA